MGQKIKLLIVDDSALIRKILVDGLGSDPNIEVVGTAHDPFEARDKIVHLKPDVLTLDLEMPRMDGLEFLQRLMPQYPLPVVIVSALAEKGQKLALDCLAAGAIDFVTKPRGNYKYTTKQMLLELKTKIKIASTVNVSHYKFDPMKKTTPIKPRGILGKTTDKMIIIGASTGGTEAIKKVLTNLPPDIPGIVIVQHMPPGYTTTFANQLNDLCPITVKEAEDGDRIITGRALISPGDKHTQILRIGGQYRVQVKAGEPICGHCPSVEALMLSAAECAGHNAIGIILTGMGKDGAGGLKAMRATGARTVGQNEESCVVFGMPKEAYRIGAVEKLVHIDQMAAAIIYLVNQSFNK